MELLIEGIEYCEKKLKGIVFELKMAKAMKFVMYLLATAITFGFALLFFLVAGSIQTSAADVCITFTVTGGCIWFLWFMMPSIIADFDNDIASLEEEKFKCERDIEKYKNDMIDLREMEKKVMKSKAKLTEKQTETLNNYTEKAKQVFKWLIVTKDGEVVASDLKPDYDDQWDTWFFNSEANTIQIGSNKKLAKHSKYTLTKIK